MLSMAGSSSYPMQNRSRVLPSCEALQHTFTSQRRGRCTCSAANVRHEEYLCPESREGFWPTRGMFTGCYGVRQNCRSRNFCCLSVLWNVCEASCQLPCDFTKAWLNLPAYLLAPFHGLHNNIVLAPTLCTAMAALEWFVLSVLGSRSWWGQIQRQPSLGVRIVLRLDESSFWNS